MNAESILEKIEVLGNAAKYDSCASTASPRKVSINETDRIGNAAKGGICHSFGPDGRCIGLFKVLFSNACSLDCKYCCNSACTRKKTATFEAEELAKTFMSLYVKNYVEGLFLSSAVIGEADRTTEKMLDTVKLIRSKYNFRGYIHFKVLPGTNYELIKQASEISDRLSVNLEAPSATRLKEVSSVKDFKIDIVRRQAWIKRMKLPSGQTTQLVVGSSDETDYELLSMINWEYKNLDLKRGYYSAFIPVPKTALEKRSATPLAREHRLYNVDFMLRKYKIPFSDFKQIMQDGMLPNEDPKVALARETFDAPVEINDASYEELLRVPGIGPLSAVRIKKITSIGRKITRLNELHNIGVVLKRAETFIKVDGRGQRNLGMWT
jgi:putative DNA modification/repair radical SAM protein